MVKAGDDLEAKLDALYAAPLAEFVGVRHALAKGLKATGRMEDAARVAALKKPSAAAWAVNQLAFSDKRLLEALEAASGRLRRNSGDVKDALRGRRQALNEAAKAAEKALAESGHRPNPDVQRRISATLESIAAHSGAEGGPVAGRLSDDVPAPGFDEIASLGLLGGGTQRARRTVIRPSIPAMASRIELPKTPSRKILERERALEEKRRRHDEQRAAALKKDVTAAQTRLAAAEKALEERLSGAKAEETRLAGGAAEARLGLQAAETALAEARSSLTAPAAGR